MYGIAPAPPPLPAVDPRLFRDAMGRFATGVAFITAADAAGAPIGMIANSLASLSLSPPLVSWSPMRDSFTWSRMRRSGRFGVSVLAAEHAELARRAAPRDADRFAGVDWEPSATGVPVIAGALAFADCAIEAEYPGGDHRIVVGRVEDVRVDREGEPLVFWASAFARLG